MCSPSRAGLLTGRSQSRFGHDINWEPEWPVKPNDTRGLPLTEKTIADQLKPAGYHSGVIGKWHLGEAPPFHPNKRGFNEFFGFIGGGHNYPTHTYRTTPPLHHYNSPLERNGTRNPPPPATSPPCSARNAPRSFIATEKSLGFFMPHSMPRTRPCKPRQNC